DAKGNPIANVSMTAMAGVAKFNNIIISEPGKYTLTVTAPEPGVLPNPPGTISTTTGPFVIGHDTPVIVGGPPQYAGSNESLGSALTVDVENASGQVDPNFTGNVTMTLLGLSNSGQAPTLGGAVTQQAMAGVATFKGLTVNLLGTGYQLMATLEDGTQSQAGDFFSVVPRTVKFVQTTFPNPAGFPNEAINP